MFNSLHLDTFSCLFHACVTRRAFKTKQCGNEGIRLAFAALHLFTQPPNNEWGWMLRWVKQRGKEKAFLYSVAKGLKMYGADVLSTLALQVSWGTCSRGGGGGSPGTDNIQTCLVSGWRLLHVPSTPRDSIQRCYGFHLRRENAHELNFGSLLCFCCCDSH